MFTWHFAFRCKEESVWRGELDSIPSYKASGCVNLSVGFSLFWRRHTNCKRCKLWFFSITVEWKWCVWSNKVIATMIPERCTLRKPNSWYVRFSEISENSICTLVTFFIRVLNEHVIVLQGVVALSQSMSYRHRGFSRLATIILWDCCDRVSTWAVLSRAMILEKLRKCRKVRLGDW